MRRTPAADPGGPHCRTPYQPAHRDCCRRVRAALGDRPDERPGRRDHHAVTHRVVQRRHGRAGAGGPGIDGPGTDGPGTDGPGTDRPGADGRAVRRGLGVVRARPDRRHPDRTDPDRTDPDRAVPLRRVHVPDADGPARHRTAGRRDRRALLGARLPGGVLLIGGATSEGGGAPLVAGVPGSAAPATLPSTGTPAALLSGAGVAAAITGAGLLTLVRRRRVGAGETPSNDG